MEQELTLAIAPLVPILGGIAAGAVGSAFAGKGDKQAAEAAQAAALEQEQKRQATLESRFGSQQPLREESLKQLLDFGSKENPFSRRIGDERAAGIIGQIQALQSQAGQINAQDKTAQVLKSIGDNPRERDKFMKAIEAAQASGGFGSRVRAATGVREAGDVLRHFGFDIGEEGVQQLISSGQAANLFDPATGIEALRSIGVNLSGASSNTPVF